MEETTEEKKLENVSLEEGLLSQESEGQNTLLADLKVPQSPLHHTTKSTFGAQILSQKLTEPSCTFGTSNRLNVDKLYFNAELAKSNPGHSSPGPAYELNSSLGKQCKSTNESPPEVHFGFANRFSRTRRGEGPPGPGSYNTPSSFGDQVLSNLKSPSGTNFGRSTRDQQNRLYASAEFDKTKYGVASPGPTICDQRSSVGTQVHSEKKTAPKTFFCSENRFKVFISMEHDKALYGEASPGPAANFRLMSSLGYQPDSRKVSGSCWGFGFAPRFKPHNDEKPGPGTYDC